MQATSKICIVHNTEDSRQRADKNTIIICISTLHLYSISSMFFQIQNRTVGIIATCLNKLSLNSTTPHIVTHLHRLIVPNHVPCVGIEIQAGYHSDGTDYHGNKTNSGNSKLLMFQASNMATSHGRFASVHSCLPTRPICRHQKQHWFTSNCG